MVGLMATRNKRGRFSYGLSKAMMEASPHVGATAEARRKLTAPEAERPESQAATRRRKQMARAAAKRAP